MPSIEELLDKVRSYHPSVDARMLERVYQLSQEAHQGQLRKSGEPFMTHPLGVAMILADMHLDPASIAVGLLHDVIEDTLRTREELETAFGKEIADLVEGVTKISKLSLEGRTFGEAAAQAETYRKMLLAMVGDIRVLLVKLADRLHNMRTLEHLEPAAQQRIARETMEIFVPLANRLGIGRVKQELEDLAFRYREPEKYQALVDKVENERRLSASFIRRITVMLEKAMSENAVEARVEGRTKSYHSMYDKMRRQQIGLDEVYDYVAFRLITPTLKDCYAALGVVHNLWSPVPGRIKDYIALPKRNGYQSLHTTVINNRGQTFEIQIRTEEMHRLAEEGIAAHWRYKEGGRVEMDERTVRWLRQLVDENREILDPHEFMSSLKLNLYPDEVYCFTPKGRLLSFPRGSTPIDFAYTIHTDIGRQCTGAKINGRMVPLKTVLSNGDVVEILTTAGHTPSRDWLATVKTSRAKTKIRQWLNRQEALESIDLGRKILERELRRYRLNLKRLIASDQLAPVLQHYGLGKLEDLFVAVGFGKIGARNVATRLLPPEELQKPPLEADGGGLAQRVRKVLGLGAGVSIKVRGHDDLLVVRAKCCNPLPGEKIFGYITRGKGVSVHAENCPNVSQLLFDSDRKIEVEWAAGKEAKQPVRISILTEDRAGMLAKITSRISDTNIKQVKANTFENRKGLIDLVLEISDIAHLESVMDTLKGIDGVLEVERAAPQS